jgi:PadR family transcriptional regulator, regulatory protein PadR
MGDKLERLEILQGTLDLLILRTLRWGPTHGHGIATSIQQTSGDRLKIEHGSLYPALQRLLQEGWIDGEWGMSATGRKARFYKLTAAGRRQLTREQSKWQQFTEVMGLVLGNPGPAGAGRSED